ncbi:tRNA 5-methoxyuridine(34)/uridine 5-oxyacetic acid(34) synthase CmoB [Helicobacter muridarum]|uniref:tRNA (Mo5U34)-methyltransferase n=1 Tax=Helicobacter muridarum TaxID=216 RepID=A0A377PRU7_9HELI|nr:tRNA 5-methoxyuridine(34)/uridine 5-oxyacetic acid(34) synthase CmoB [Helicobacter muridarum]TLE01398.1 tRNA 5-methoxyuridine(34)/uridine 5-oxyacetic acid(34) synthase CmoB [Helicobacter muridarum]STQ85327.1 tRNA (mo5U34)-methyltransferase [Helicobacter muridarum]
MQNLIMSDSLYGNLTRDFLPQEISILESPSNADILLKIEKLKFDVKSCFSIVDSKLSAYLWGLESEVSLDAIKKTLGLAQMPQTKFDNSLQNGVHVVFDLSKNDVDLQSLHDIVLLLKPWRKGPFYLHANHLDMRNSIFIDSEWQSHIKMKAVLNVLEILNYQISGKDILDVGCNNGYYMFDLVLRGAKSVLGIDPVGIFFLQFYLILKLTKLDNVSYRLLGVQDIYKLNKKFDCIFCMGVLYHRAEPFQALKSLKKALKKGGLLIIETLIIEEDSPIALFPYPTYAKMNNVFYIFSPSALRNLSLRAGFSDCELISLSYTDNNEQRSTGFINKQSLGDFLGSKHTEEGYPPVCRGIFALHL